MLSGKHTHECQHDFISIICQKLSLVTSLFFSFPEKLTKAKEDNAGMQNVLDQTLVELNNL